MANFIDLMNQLPPEILWVIMMLAGFSTLMTLARLFGESGIYIYIVIAIISANLQVLKIVSFSFLSDPLALGTVLFVSTYLATDILAEHYGSAAARRGVWLGFAGLITSNIFMLITLGFQPLDDKAAGTDFAWAVPMQDHLEALFIPQPSFLIAGMMAYLISQLHDVWLFDRLRRSRQGKDLWLRNNVSSMLSSLIDNTVFSLIAFYVLAIKPVPWDALVSTYILGLWWLRLSLALLDTPVIYLARLILPPRPSSSEDIHKTAYPCPLASP